MRKNPIIALALVLLLLSACLTGCSGAAPNGLADGYAAQEHGLQAPMEAEPDMNTEEYKYLTENSFQSVTANPFATFAADVDTASYSNFRRQVMSGSGVRPDSVRVEEFINYFHYDYPQPQGDDPFGVKLEVGPCPWNAQTQLLSVGLQAKSLDTEALPPSNLVFLIDVSGSMDSPNKLPLVQRSFLTLAEALTEKDRVSIVTYSSGERLVLEGVSGAERQQIAAAIESLYASGSTRGDKAIEMAYELAEKYYIEGGINRVIMATDGDFNVGVTGEGELTRLVQDKAKGGVFLSVLGYGMGNYKDSKLESMADNGNGNYAYIDDISEARRVLVNEAGGTLFTVAKDVKLQVEFNPTVLKGYRLIGYENRVMSATDFADDTKDGGEIGAGHQVTALFEIVPVDSEFEIPGVSSKYDQGASGGENYADELCTLNIRYKEPESSESVLKSYPVTKDLISDSLSDNLRWAAGVAEAAMVLRKSDYVGSSTLQSALELLTPLANDGFREEFVSLLSRVD